jgi:predicted nucleic acid-binding protein
MPAAQVLDSHALLAYFRQEPGGERVKEMLHKAATADRPLHMTEVNYAEVNYMIRRKEGDDAWGETTRILETLPIEYHPVTRALADQAAMYKAGHKLSLADAFAAALAKEKKAELVTGDPEFKALEKEIKIHWLK